MPVQLVEALPSEFVHFELLSNDATCPVDCTGAPCALAGLACARARTLLHARRVSVLCTQYKAAAHRSAAYDRLSTAPAAWWWWTVPGTLALLDQMGSEVAKCLGLDPVDFEQHVLPTLSDHDQLRIREAAVDGFKLRVPDGAAPWPAAPEPAQPGRPAAPDDHARSTTDHHVRTMKRVDEIVFGGWLVGGCLPRWGGIKTALNTGRCLSE